MASEMTAQLSALVGADKLSHKAHIGLVRAAETVLVGDNAWERYVVGSESYERALVEKEALRRLSQSDPASMTASARRGAKSAAAREAEAALQANPHVRQLGAPAWRRYADPSLHPLDSLPRRLDDVTRMKYRRRRLNERSTNHWGQLKLMSMEVEFLTEYARGPGSAEEKWVVVYAGAAPGQHTAYLASLFPNCTFILYDPAEFCEALINHPHRRITVVNGFFTEDSAEEYKGRDNVLFISDIRTCKTPAPVDDTGEEDGEGGESAEVQAAVRKDMDRQAAWVKTIKPVASMLKCRFPWDAGTTPYFRGEIRIQPCCPTASTETRLIVTRADLAAEPVAYDHTEYEERMMYHNSVGRARLYDHGLPEPLARRIPGLDHCYDCASVARIFRDYLAAGRAEPPTADKVALLYWLALRAISTKRTLATRAAVSTSVTAARGGFRRRDYTDDKLTYLDGKKEGW